MDELILSYVNGIKKNDPAEIQRVFANSVKQGNLELSKTLLLNKFLNDDLSLLYKGRYYSQTGQFTSFINFFDKYNAKLSSSNDLKENLLPLYWRMGISKAQINDFSGSERFFDIHREISSLSLHQRAHYYQCYGSFLIASEKSNTEINHYLSNALESYFSVTKRDEPYYSTVDNIRCIVMNIIMQAITDYEIGDIDMCFRKLTYCKLWLSKSGLKKTASGFSELFMLLEKKYHSLIDYLFSYKNINFSDDKIIAGILEAKDIFDENKLYDIKELKHHCIILNRPQGKKKYFFMETLEMQTKKVFVVQGRNKKINSSMFQFLTSLRLDPIEWEQARNLTGKATPYIGEILEKAFNTAQAVVVLLTPDEQVKLDTRFSEKKSDEGVSSQPRPNVIFEAGAAFAAHPDRTILVAFGDIRVWSDIEGRHLIKMDNSAEQRNALVSRLKSAGCELNIEFSSEWISQGDFELEGK